MDSCGLTGGAAGGPWCQKVSAADSRCEVMSVLSYKRGKGRIPDNGGPRLHDNSAECLYRFARSISFSQASGGVIVTWNSKDCGASTFVSDATSGDGNDFACDDDSCIGRYACESKYDALRRTTNVQCGSCHGTSACEPAMNSNTPIPFSRKGIVGVRSCIGKRACVNAGEDVRIGSESCQGFGACEIAGGGLCLDPHHDPKQLCERSGTRATTIADNSCIGQYACRKASEASIGSNSCIGNSACHRAGGTEHDLAGDDDFGEAQINSNSCVGNHACFFVGIAKGKSIVDTDSCNGRGACDRIGSFGGHAAVGTFSCRGDKSCDNVGNKGVATIGTQSCIGFRACFQLAFDGRTAYIDSYSCNGTGACSNRTQRQLELVSWLEQTWSSPVDVSIGSNSCNAFFACSGQHDVGNNQCNTPCECNIFGNFDCDICCSKDSNGNYEDCINECDPHCDNGKGGCWNEDYSQCSFDYCPTGAPTNPPTPVPTNPLTPLPTHVPSNPPTPLPTPVPTTQAPTTPVPTVSVNRFIIACEFQIYFD